MSEEEGLVDMFEEPASFRPPPPQPSVRTLPRPNNPDGSANAPFTLRLIGHHSLWAHCLWNASVVLGAFMDRGKINVSGCHVLELGAGAAVPSITAALHGASQVVVTDYPDKEIIDNISHNVSLNIHDSSILARVHVQGYLWGKDVTPLLQPLNGAKFDVIIMSDLVFNHTQHNNMLKTCRECLKPDGKIYCIFSHHRPWLEHADMNILELARGEPYGFNVQEHSMTRMPVMFENDPGSEDVRSLVKCYVFTLPQ